MKKGVPYEPRGTIRGFLDLYRAGGIRGLYTGFRLHALRDTLVSFRLFCRFRETVLILHFRLIDSGNWVLFRNVRRFSISYSTECRQDGKPSTDSDDFCLRFCVSLLFLSIFFFSKSFALS
jgi:hypothetical protein